MKLELRRALIGLTVAGSLVLTPPAVGYAVDALDAGIRTRAHGTTDQRVRSLQRSPLTDVLKGDNDNNGAPTNGNDNDGAPNDNGDGEMPADPGANDPNNNDHHDGGSVDPGSNNNDPGAGISSDVTN